MSDTIPDLLPPNATPLERAISQMMGRIDTLAVPIRDTWNEDICPENLLPWLANAFSVDDWLRGWSEEQQRAVIKSSVTVHRRKGTIGAVKDALAALSINVQIQEWHRQVPVGEPYTFKLFLGVDQSGITQAAQLGLFEVIARAKNLRSHMDGITITVTSQTALHVASAAGVGSILSLTNYQWPQIAIHEDQIIL